MTQRRKAHGFSVIELLVVMVIILIVAALAIPNFLRSRMRANETAAIAALRSITTAQVSYQSTYNRGYSPSLDALKPPAPGNQPTALEADLIDPVLATTQRNGYVFNYTPVDSDGDGIIDQYTINANPLQPGRTGDKYFFVDHSNIIRENIGGPADATSTPIPKQ